MEKYLELLNKILEKYEDHILFSFFLAYILGFFTGFAVAIAFIYYAVDTVIRWIKTIWTSRP